MGGGRKLTLNSCYVEKEEALACTGRMRVSEETRVGPDPCHRESRQIWRCRMTL